MPLSDSLKNLSHHAYLLIGSDPIHAELLSILENKHKMRAQANTDFFDRHYENVTIDDARELKTAHGMRPVGVLGKKIFVIRAHNIGHEAQNALLKLFEEPAEYAHFFLIVPSGHILLPTVKSRMCEISLARSDLDISRSDLAQEAQSFVKLTPAKRLEVVKKLVEDITKEKKTKQDAIDFVNAVQATIYKVQGVKKGKLALQAIEHARTYLNDRAPSVKMLLEYVALNL